MLPFTLLPSPGHLFYIAVHDADGEEEDGGDDDDANDNDDDVDVQNVHVAGRRSPAQDDSDSSYTWIRQMGAAFDKHSAKY